MKQEFKEIWEGVPKGTRRCLWFVLGAVFILIVLMATSCSMRLAEEIVEDIIEEEVGVRIDLPLVKPKPRL